MPLNPLAFDNEEEFKKALNEKGKKSGWVPFFTNLAQSAIEHIITHDGKKKVSALK